MIAAPYSVIEAEDFEISRGFRTVSADFASGGAYVQQISGATARIATDVEGRPGTYDVAVRYFDESDGRSEAVLEVDGVVQDEWVWNEQLGSSSADTRTATTHVVRGVTLDADARIAIEGTGDGGEPLRIDGIELLPTDVRAVEAAPAGRSASSASSPLRSFEGAEGFGTTTPGGRGGTIVKVTTLNDSGPGSLRWALEDLEMPRIVVFEIGGRIDLKSEIRVNGDVTVAGQTAPGDGITVSGARLRIVEDDAIVRGLKLRPGVTDADNVHDRDAISVGNSSDRVERVVIDSNSLSWALDETAVVWYGSRDVTFSNNIIAEGLENNGRPSFGMLIGDGSQRITVSDNLFANNFHRNPQVKDDSRQVEFVNNVVSNYGDNGFEVPDNTSVTAHIVGNVFVAGDDTADNNPVRLRSAGSSKYYIEDNLGSSRPRDGLPEKAIAEGIGLSKVQGSPVFSGSGVRASESSDVLEDVLGSVGARAQGVDDTDRRLIREVEDGTGRIISSPGQVGGYDAPRSTDAPRDRDDDGIPDAFEPIVGSDPDRFDPHGDGDGDGYSNIETYINGLIDGFGPAPAPAPAVAPAKPAPSEPAPSKRAPSEPGDLRVQAEDFEALSNFVVDRNPHASGDTLIRAEREGRESRAETAFEGADGVYDLRVGYFDEADGASRLSVVVEGRTVAEWDLDRQLGSDYATEGTLTGRTVEDVRLARGDSVALVGEADGDEPLRIDTIDFVFDYV